MLGAARAAAEPQFDRGSVYLLETRPDEGGRAVVRRIDDDGRAVDVTPPGANVRTSVNEYGGGAWCVRDGQVVYSTFPDGYLHVLAPRGGPRTVVAEDGLRFADLEPDPGRGRVLAVCEDHTVDDRQPATTLVAVDLASGERTLLVGGRDFVSDPRLDAAGRRLCWLAWDLPDMPWDATELWVADLDDGGLPREPVLVAGGRGESVVSPRWAPDGSLVLVSDRSGWWNPYRWTPGTDALEPLAPLEVEFAGPQWVFGLRTTAPLADGSVLAIGRSLGRDTLYRLRAGSEPVGFDLPATDLEYLSVEDGRAVVLAHAPTEPSVVLGLDLATGAHEQRYAASSLELDRRYLSVPRHVAFPTAEGRTAFAYYYPPTNPDAASPEGDSPPLLVLSHGGPTSSADTRLLLRHQFFTSRGFAVVDVDYGGAPGTAASTASA